MNGTMRKRVVSGLVALGMILSPTGTGLGTLSAFAEDGASSGTVSGETDPTGGETDPEDGETGSEDGETGSEDSEEGSEDGETGSEEGEEDSEDKTTSYEERFDLSDNSVLYTDTDLSALTETLTGDVIPYYGIHILNEWPEESNNVYNAINAYTPGIYSSADGYNALTSTEKKLYEEMYARAVAIDTSTENGTEDIPVKYYDEDGNLSTKYLPGFIDSNGNGRVTFSVSGTTTTNLKRAFNALGYDNPQFFWLGHSYMYFSDDSGITGMIFRVDEKLTEYLNGSKRQSTKSELFEVVDKVIEGASIYANEYSKEWYIHDYLCNNTIYDPELHEAGESPYDHDVTGLLLHGVCVCESYAKCTQLFLNALDIENLYIVGRAESGNPSSGHAWNQICLDGDWYNFDSTWDDLAPEYQKYYDNAQYYYRWFNVTDDNFVSDHYAFEGYTEVYSSETCTATKYSYDNHSENFQMGDSDFLVSGNGKTKSVASVKEALSYISKSNNSKADYVITYTGEVIDDELADVTVSSAVTVGAAKSVTFAGPASYTFKNGFTANCDVIFEAEATLGGNVTSDSKAITVKNPGSEGNTVYFAENAVVSIKTLNFEGPFANAVDGGAKSINITAVKSTADNYNNGNNQFFIMSGNAVVGTITNTGTFDLCIEQNANVSVTGAVTSNGGEKVNLIPVAEKDGYLNYTEIANGTTLLNAKTAAADCFKSAYTIIGEEEAIDYNYAIYKDGTAIKATLPRVYAYYGEEVDYYGAYALFDEAVTAINGDKSLSGVPVTIVITDNVETAKFALPTKVKSVTVTSTSGQSITVKDAASVSVGVDLTLNNVAIETTNTKGYTLTTSKNLTLNGFSSKTLTALKGGAKSELTLDSMFGGCNITGFGTMTVNAGFDAGSPITVNVGSLVINGRDGYDIYVSSDTTAFTVKDITGKSEGGVAEILYGKNANPITITGNAYGSILVSSEVNFTDGMKVFTAKTADMSVFTLNSANLPTDGFNYTLTRTGSDLCVGKVVFSVKVGSDVLAFVKWSDVINTINTRKNPNAEYTVGIIDDTDIGGALTMPKAKTFSSLAIQGNTGSETLTFTGTSISLTGNTIFYGIKLNSVKKGTTTPTSFNIAAGKNDLGLVGVSGSINNVTSSGMVIIDSTTVKGNLTADLLYVYPILEMTSPESSNVGIPAINAFPIDAFSGKTVADTGVTVEGALNVKTAVMLLSSLTVKGSFTAGGIGTVPSDTNADGVSLVLYKNKKAASIGKGGIEGYQIKFALVDPATGKTAKVEEGTVIATISGPYADQLSPSDLNLDSDDTEVGYYIIKEGKNLVAKSKATEGLVKVTSSGGTAYYTSLEEAVKDISATGSSNQNYTIYLAESKTYSKLPLPSAKKYGSIVFTSEKPVTLTVKSDISLTGNLLIYSKVTVNKVNSKNEVVPIGINVGTYTFMGSCKLSHNGTAHQITNISGKGTFSLAGDIAVSGKVNVGTFVFSNNTVTLGAKSGFAGAVDSTNGTLEYTLANAKNIKLGTITGSLAVALDSEPSHGQQIAALTGDYTEDAVVISGSSKKAVRSGNNLVAFAADKAIVVTDTTDAGNPVNRVYDSVANAVTDITRIGNASGTYTVKLNEDVTLSKLPLPTKGKYTSIKFVADSKVTISITSDITLTGKLIIGNNVTLRKVKSLTDSTEKALKITAPRNSGFFAAAEGSGVISNGYGDIAAV